MDETGSELEEGDEDEVVDERPFAAEAVGDDAEDGLSKKKSD